MGKMKSRLIQLIVITACFGMAVQNAVADEPVMSSAKVTLYGFIHADASYSTGSLPIGNFALYAASGSQDPELNLTANGSRLGLNLSGLETEGSAVKGKFEIDFYGGGSNSKANPRMRQAYLEMVWKKMDLTLLAGQAWDVVSPVIPPTVNFGINWYAGNLGFRHPQLRLTKGMGPVTVKLAALRPMETINDTGYNMEMPMLQGSVSYALPMGEKRAYIGFSGHYSQDEDGTDNAKKYYESHVISLDLNIPVGDMLAIKAEVWKGTNADIIMGGIGQGYAGGDSLNTQGGWAGLTVNIAESASINLIGSIDTVQDDQLGTGGRTQNMTAAINIKTKLMEKVTWGVEVSQWTTQYKNADDGEVLRLQSLLIYSF